MYTACVLYSLGYAFRPSDGTQTLRKHKCYSGASSAKASATSHSIIKWTQSGSKLQKVPTTLINKLNRNVVMTCALDFRPLNFAHGEGFEALAQTLVDIGAHCGSVDIRSLLRDRTTYSRKVLPKLADDA